MQSSSTWPKPSIPSGSMASSPKLPVLHSPHNLIVPPGSDVRRVLPDGHVISSTHEGSGGSGWIDHPCPLQSVSQRHALNLSQHRVCPLHGHHGHHGHVPQADINVSYLELYLNDFQWWMSKWRIDMNVSKNSAIIFARVGRRFIQHRPVTLFGEPIQ